MTGRSGCPVVRRVRDVARRYADLTAVVGSGRELSYAGLWRQVERWRERCAALDVPPRSPVAVVCDGQPELPAAFLGVRSAGLVPVLVDGRLPAARLAATVDAVRPAAAIRLPEPDVVPAAPRPHILPDGAGYIVFSSGSQGTPKGIIGYAQGLLHFLDWEIRTLGVRPGTRTALLTSPSFDVVFRDLLLPLLAGGELHIAEGRVRSSPPAVLPWLAEHAVGVVHAVPSVSARWVAAAPAVLPELRWTLFAGEPLYDRQVARWRLVAPGSRIVNLYGPSETTLAKLWYEVPAGPVPGVQPVGRPLPDTAVELEPVTAADGTVEAHSITIATRYGSLGYLPGTCSAGERLRLRRTPGMTRFRTRDRGHLGDDGNLVVTGRLDSLVKRHGAFVDLAAIESAAAALTEVRSTCCLQLAPTGRILLAVEAAGSTADLRRRLYPRLGTALPDRIVVVPALPLLPSGKVDREALAAMYADPPAADHTHDAHSPDEESGWRRTACRP